MLSSHVDQPVEALLIAAYARAGDDAAYFTAREREWFSLCGRLSAALAGHEHGDGATCSSCGYHMCESAHVADGFCCACSTDEHHVEPALRFNLYNPLWTDTIERLGLRALPRALPPSCYICPGCEAHHRAVARTFVGPPGTFSQPPTLPSDPYPWDIPERPAFHLWCDSALTVQRDDHTHGYDFFRPIASASGSRVYLAVDPATRPSFRVVGATWSKRPLDVALYEAKDGPLVLIERCCIRDEHFRLGSDPAFVRPVDEDSLDIALMIHRNGRVGLMLHDLLSTNFPYDPLARYVFVFTVPPATTPCAEAVLSLVDLQAGHHAAGVTMAPAISSPTADDASGPIEAIDCIICMAAPVSHLLTPCGHYGFCVACARRCSRRPCPVCGKLVSDTVRVFPVAPPREIAI